MPCKESHTKTTTITRNGQMIISKRLLKGKKPKMFLNVAMLPQYAQDRIGQRTLSHTRCYA